VSAVNNSVIRKACLLALLCALSACALAQAPADPLARYQPQPYVKLQHPEWTKDAVIYQINTRQFTPEGTFTAAQRQLPRLKALGADILWLMPIHPIGEKNRKGTLGSPYAVRDYLAVNPEFGTLDDLRAFVHEAHRLGMHVILDWVANHSAWDNPLHAAHPDWYLRDYKGDFHPTSWWDWSDIIEFDYAQPGLREYMTRALRYWVQQADIDGYRCDVASFVPLDFWNNARRELDAIKPVFMLAEADSRDLHAEAFDATYGWPWWDAMHAIAQGKADVGALHGYYSGTENAFPGDAMRMVFVSNHDKNAWEGTEFESFGDALPAAIVLSVVGAGIPLIYNGQEAGNRRRLAFFAKDPINWQAHPLGELYRRLFALKKQHSVLWNGHWGAPMIPVPNSAPAQVLSFVRRNDTDQLFAVFNFSAQAQTVRFKEPLYPGTYRDAFGDATLTLDADSALSLAPWQYRVLLRDGRGSGAAAARPAQ